MALWWPSWWENATAGHNFGRGPSNDYSIQVWFQTRWFLCEFPIGSYVKLSSAVQPFWSEGWTTRHNFGRGPSNDYFIKVWFQLSTWFQTRRFLCEFPTGSYVKLSSTVGPSWSKGRTARHIFGREPSNDYFINI